MFSVFLMIKQNVEETHTFCGSSQNITVDVLEFIEIVDASICALFNTVLNDFGQLLEIFLCPLVT